MAKLKKLILGNDFLDFISCLDKKKKSIFIKSSSDYNTYSMSEIELKLLKEMLNKQELLDELVGSIVPQKLVLRFDGLIIELGQSSYVNFLELYRKLGINDYSHLYEVDETQFNIKVELFLQELVAFFAKGEQLRYQILALAKRHPEVYSFMLPLIDFMQRPQAASKSFYYLMQVSFGSSFSSVFDESFSLYLLAFIISPQYRFDQNEYFEKQFSKSFELLSFIEQRELNLDTSGKKLLADVEDERLEVEVVELGSSFDKYKLIPSTHLSHYQSLSFKVNLKEKLSSFKNKRIVMTSFSEIGKSTPHFEIVGLDDGSLIVQYFHLVEDGVKDDFYLEQALKDVFSGLTSFNMNIEFSDWSRCAELLDVKKSYIWDISDANNKYAVSGSCLERGVAGKKSHLKANTLRFSQMGLSSRIHQLLA